jgi:hypothetical protein
MKQSVASFQPNLAGATCKQSGLPFPAAEIEAEAGKHLHSMIVTTSCGVEVARREEQILSVSRKLTTRNGVGKTQAIGLGGSHHPDPMCYSSDISAHRLGGNLTLRLGWHASESI